MSIETALAVVAGAVVPLLAVGVAWGILSERVRALDGRLQEVRNERASNEALASLRISVDALRRDVERLTERLDRRQHDTDPGYRVPRSGEGE